MRWVEGGIGFFFIGIMLFWVWYWRNCVVCVCMGFFGMNLIEDVCVCVEVVFDVVFFECLYLCISIRYMYNCNNV